jgi:mono/diheme cytochrome c family protein
MSSGADRRRSLQTCKEMAMPALGKSVAAAAATVAAAALISLGLVPAAKEACAAQAKMSFAEDVMPIFKGRCVSCHQPGGEGFEKSGLDLTTYAGVMKGNKHGPMVLPGDAQGSNLMWLLDWRASPELRMPHGKRKLSTCDRDAIRAWINEGAKNN